MKLIFQIRTIEETNILPNANYKTVREVSFTEPTKKDGTRNIIVKTTKIHYKDMKSKENQILEKKDLGEKTYHWNGKQFVSK